MRERDMNLSSETLILSNTCAAAGGAHKIKGGLVCPPAHDPHVPSSLTRLPRLCDVAKAVKAVYGAAIRWGGDRRDELDLLDESSTPRA